MHFYVITYRHYLENIAWKSQELKMGPGNRAQSGQLWQCPENYEDEEGGVQQ